MAFRLRCYICNDSFRLNLLRRLNEDRKTEISTRYRKDLQLPEEEINNNTRICINCDRCVLQEIQAYEEDEDPTILKVLHKSAARYCFVCYSDDIQIQRVLLDLRTNIFLNTGIYVPEHVRVCGEHLNSRGMLFNPLLNGLRSIRRPYNLKGSELMTFLGSPIII